MGIGDVEGVNEVSGSCAVIVWLGVCQAANLCEQDPENACEAADEKGIEHVGKLDCDSLLGRGYCGICCVVLCGRRTARWAFDQSF